ncbi:MAG TPA: PAS domain S-box protein [Segetibacter sp.]|nr:PAS domain S-box protein [Segetibacter sp.]
MSTEDIKDIIQEKGFKDFFDNVHDLIQVVDLQGKIVYVNSAWLKVSGYSLDEIKEQSIYSFVADEDKQLYQEYRSKVVAGNKPEKEILVRFKAKGGKNVLLEGSSTLRNNKDNSSCTLGIFRDVTAKIESAIQLKEREFNLQQLLQNAPDAIVVINPESDITFWNPAAEKLFGWTTEEILNKSLADTIIPAQYREAHYNGMRRSMISKRHGINKTVEITALNKAGDEFYISLTISTTTLNGNIAFISFIRDIREKKKNEEELENKKKELETANKQLEQSNMQLENFAHVASHDIKEPIRKIRMFAERLQHEFSEDIPEGAKQYLNKINAASERLNNIVNGILSYATAKGFQKELEPVELTKIIKTIESDLEVLIEEKKAVIKYQYLDELIGIDFLIYQLFYNLIANSLKFSRTGVEPVIEITTEQVHGIHLEIEGIDKTKEFIQVKVRDNGIGFKQEYAHKIFNTFARLNTKTEYEGTGLGLSLCKSIIERHNGYIIAEGREGEGAVFYVLFPDKE